eukprot:7388314-Prymnesium_polylepis.1
MTMYPEVDDRPVDDEVIFVSAGVDPAELACKLLPHAEQNQKAHWGPGAKCNAMLSDSIWDDSDFRANGIELDTDSLIKLSDALRAGSKL